MPNLPAQCGSAGVEEVQRRRRRWDGGWRGQREARREAASVGPRIARDGPPATASSRRLAVADETPERRIGHVASLPPLPEENRLAEAEGMREAT